MKRSLLLVLINFVGFLFSAMEMEPSETPPDILSSSNSSLGKRKASITDLSAETSIPPRKILRSAPIADEDANVFFDGSKSKDAVIEDPDTPISLVCAHIRYISFFLLTIR